MSKDLTSEGLCYLTSEVCCLHVDSCDACYLMNDYQKDAEMVHDEMEQNYLRSVL